MEQNTIILELRKGAKIYQVVTVLIVIVCLIYLSQELWSIRESAESQVLLLVSIFSFFCLAALYMLIYSFRHRIEFHEDRMIRRGVFKHKQIEYKDISLILFTRRLFQLSGTSILLRDPKAIHIDFKYDQEETGKAIHFLKLKFDYQYGPKIETH